MIEQIQRLKERQLELQAVMQHSDAHACKCIKLGLVFEREYAQEFAEYMAAREEYNTNEPILRELEENENNNESIEMEENGYLL